MKVIAFAVAAGSRAQREFAFRATTPFDAGLRKTIEWHQSHQPATASALLP